MSDAHITNKVRCVFFVESTSLTTSFHSLLVVSNSEDIVTYLLLLIMMLMVEKIHLTCRTIVVR